MALTTTTTTVYRFSPALHCLSSPTQYPHKPINSLLCPNSFKPIFSSKPNPSLKLSRSRFCHTSVVTPKRASLLLAVSGLVDGSSETHPDSEPNDSSTGANIDIKLPRRSLLVQFTCNVCGERTKRLINRLAYERGLIFVQCAGCLRHHKLVDNLGLMVEYDFREESNIESNMDSNTDQF